MKTKLKHQGYLLIDNRHAPAPGGVFGGREFIGAGTGVLEAATITCSHCQTILIVNHDRTRARGYCRRCDHYVCDQCTGGDCVTFKAKLDRLQEAAVTEASGKV